MKGVEYDGITDEGELEQLTNEAHRAIGRYVVCFSQLVYQMRTLAGDVLTKEAPLAELAFGAAPAGQIADSFFAMCRYRGNFASAELNIANQLQTEVGERITERNKIMHGDWWVGGALGGDRAILERARLMRTYPNRRNGDFARIENYSIQDLDEISERLFLLRVLIDDFGRAALGLPMRLRDEGMGHAGEFRVSDVLVARDVSKNGKGGAVVREGPRASELFDGRIFG